MKVKLNAPFRIVHQGVPYADGAVIEVPKDDTTATWSKANGLRPVPIFTERQMLMPYQSGPGLGGHHRDAGVQRGQRAGYRRRLGQQQRGGLHRRLGRDCLNRVPGDRQYAGACCRRRAPNRWPAAL